MTDIIKIKSGSEKTVISEFKTRFKSENDKIEADVKQIMDDVLQNGWDAVVKYSLKFDGAEPREFSQSEITKAANACPKELYAALEKSVENIRDYQSRLLPESMVWETENGRLGQFVRAVERAGIYIPGGTAAYPSSVLMCAVPAKAAGVREVIMLTPPTDNLNNAVIAAAQIAGVDRIIALGGVQAVAALAYGAGFVPKADKIAGPGNAYVAAAKRLAYGYADIDMIAGPSDITVVADETADPRLAASDMLAQAEHDRLASAILVTTSAAFAEEVKRELGRQAAKLERFDIIKDSLALHGAILLCESIESVVEAVNEIAPEHLELMTDSSRELLPCIKNAGAVFLGASSPEALGDYMAGPSHVLPTSGTARFFSPLSVESFIKRTSLIEFSPSGLRNAGADIIRIAESEKLQAHANSVRLRLS